VSKTTERSRLLRALRKSQVIATGYELNNVSRHADAARAFGYLENAVARYLGVDIDGTTGVDPKPDRKP